MNDETLEQLLSEEEIRQQMSDITRRYPSERRRLKAAQTALRRKESRAYLAAKFMQPHLLTVQEARDACEGLKKSAKVIKEDLLAVQALEVEPEQTEYDLALFDCETSDKQFTKLDRQLSYYQTLMKFTGPTVKLGRETEDFF